MYRLGWKVLTLRAHFQAFLPWKPVKMTAGHTILLRISEMWWNAIPRVFPPMPHLSSPALSSANPISSPHLLPDETLVIFLCKTSSSVKSPFDLTYCSAEGMQGAMPAESMKQISHGLWLWFRVCIYSCLQCTGAVRTKLWLAPFVASMIITVIRTLWHGVSTDLLYDNWHLVLTASVT